MFAMISLMKLDMCIIRLIVDKSSNVRHSFKQTVQYADKMISDI